MGAKRSVLLGVAVSLVLWAQYSTARADERPNILFAMADDWSHGHARIYGCKWVKTPAFDRVAREGLLFTRAYTPNAKCAPSRSCLLTGRNSWQLKEAANHICFFPPEFKVYTEALSENGYFVGYTGKGWGPGVAKDADGKPRPMTGKPFNKRRSRPDVNAISGNDYAGNFVDFLDAAPKGAPWCFWLGTTEPHRGYEYGAGAAKRGKNPDSIEHVPDFWPDNEIVRNDMLDYAVEVEHFDQHLGRVLRTLGERGLLENTLIVATSDHGMPFPRCKGQAYDYSNHVPLAIRWGAGIAKPGRVVEDYVSFIDLAPTYLQAARVDWGDSGMQPSPGQSLFDIFQSSNSGNVTTDRDHVLVGKERHDIGRPDNGGYPIRGIVKNDWLYLRNFEPDRWPSGHPLTGYLTCDGSPTKTVVLNGRRDRSDVQHWKLCFGKRPAEELYDLTTDPYCINNRASDATATTRKESLQKQMTEELKAQGDPRMFGNGAIFDRYRYSNPATNDFYKRYMAGEKVRAGWVNQTDFEKTLPND